MTMKLIYKKAIRILSGKSYLEHTLPLFILNKILPIKENATLNNVSFLEEIYRVVAHGCLHLCGYKDKEPGDVVIMREKEDFAISLIVSRETKN